MQRENAPVKAVYGEVDVAFAAGAQLVREHRVSQAQPSIRPSWAQSVDGNNEHGAAKLSTSSLCRTVGGLRPFSGAAAGLIQPQLSRSTLSSPSENRTLW